MKPSSTLCWPLVFAAIGFVGCTKPIPTPGIPNDGLAEFTPYIRPHLLPHNWLKVRETIDVAEAKGMHAIGGFGTEQRPFGSRYKDWEDFKRLFTSDCELWFWNSLYSGIGKNLTIGGYCLIRNNKIIAIVLTEMVTGI